LVLWHFGVGPWAASQFFNQWLPFFNVAVLHFDFNIFFFKNEIFQRGSHSLMALWRLFLLGLLLPCSSSVQFPSHTNPVPISGWNTWNNYGCDINEDLILRQATAIAESPSLSKLYTYIIIDDCWMAPQRDPSTHRLVPDKTRFPSGVQALAAKIHAIDLKLGIYTSVGATTCEGFPASYGHFELDAQTFTDWGVDYLKIDTCGLVGSQHWNPMPHYEEMSTAIKKSQPRPVQFIYR